MLTLALALLAATPIDGAAVLLRGEIETAKPLPNDMQDPNSTQIGGPTRVSLRIRRIIAGSWSDDPRHLQTTVSMSSIPQARGLRDIYLLLEQRQGSWQPIQWSYAKSGICIPDDYATAHGLAAQLPQLKARAIINCH